MMGRKAARNMYSSNTNKIGNQCICWFYSQGICYNARLYDRKMQHMLLQFVLKHDKWRALREVEAYPSSMCPSHPEAVSLATSLIKQIVEFHPDIQYLHIGADEV